MTEHRATTQRQNRIISRANKDRARKENTFIVENTIVIVGVGIVKPKRNRYFDLAVNAMSNVERKRKREMERKAIEKCHTKSKHTPFMSSCGEPKKKPQKTPAKHDRQPNERAKMRFALFSVHNCTFFCELLDTQSGIRTGIHTYSTQLPALCPTSFASNPIRPRHATVFFFLLLLFASSEFTADCVGILLENKCERFSVYWITMTSTRRFGAVRCWRCLRRPKVKQENLVCKAIRWFSRVNLRFYLLKSKLLAFPLGGWMQTAVGSRRLLPNGGEGTFYFSIYHSVRDVFEYPICPNSIDFLFFRHDSTQLRSTQLDSTRDSIFSVFCFIYSTSPQLETFSPAFHRRGAVSSVMGGPSCG